MRPQSLQNLEGTGSDICFKLFQSNFCVCGQNIIWHGVGNLSVIFLVIFSLDELMVFEVLQGSLNSCSPCDWGFVDLILHLDGNSLPASLMKTHRGRSSRVLLAEKDCWTISFLASNQHCQAVAILSGNNYSLISSQACDAFFHLFYGTEKWTWETVVASGLEEICPAPPQQILRALNSSDRLKWQENG